MEIVTDVTDLEKNGAASLNYSQSNLNSYAALNPEIHEYLDNPE